MLRLKCPAQTYAWGRPAEESEVASLAAAGGTEVDPKAPYAELWMGTHPSGPSEIIIADGGGGEKGENKKLLQSFLDENAPAAVGAASAERFGPATLPFLFKVLSVQTALSIQSHPDKKLAEKLHKEKPEWYKDDNHKPEMAIALGDDFSALCGFETPQAIAEALKKVPELRSVVGEGPSSSLEKAAAAAAGGDDVKPALREAFTALMTAEAGPVGDAVDALVKRVSESDGKDEDGGGGDEAVSASLKGKLALAKTLAGQYPRDVGVFAAFFLNHLKLKDGEAVALPANEPHAYVSGQLVECMAASDNVVRAGLTPKPRDTEVLCSSLTYSTGPPEILRGEGVQEFVRRYDPGFDEFEVCKVEIPSGKDTLLPPGGGPSVLLVIGGGGGGGGGVVTATATPLGDSGLLQKSFSAKKGDVLFVPAGTPLSIVAGSDAPFVGWLASVNASVVGTVEVVAPAPAAVPTPETEAAPVLAAA